MEVLAVLIWMLIVWSILAWIFEAIKTAVEDSMENSKYNGKMYRLDKKTNDIDVEKLKKQMLNFDNIIESTKNKYSFNKGMAESIQEKLRKNSFKAKSWRL